MPTSATPPKPPRQSKNNIFPNSVIFELVQKMHHCTFSGSLCLLKGYLKAETMLPIKLNLPIVLTALLAASGIAQTVQHYRLKSVQTQLAYAKTDLETSRSELNQANERATALQAANQQMMQQLAAAQAEAAARRDALTQALQANAAWRDTELPAAVKEQLKK